MRRMTKTTERVYDKMKITKRHLRRIIKEEKRKLLRESIADMAHVEALIKSAAENIAGMISEDLAGMPDEDPDAFSAGHSSLEEWNHQVNTFQIELASVLADRINTAIDETEMRLHNGEFLR